MKTRILTCAILLITGCAEQVSPSNSNQGNTQQKTSESEINGTWMSPCEPGNSEYVQSHLTFNNGFYQQRIQFHPDVNCQTLRNTPTILEGTYNTGNQFTTSDGVVARELDYHINDKGTILHIPDIYLLRDGLLYLGPQSNGRPLNLDFNYPYLRQN